MPMPVSRTLTCASSPARRASTVTDPPSGVNFTALVSRFRITCLSLRSSAWAMPRLGSMSHASEIAWLAARSRTIATPCSIRSAQRDRFEVELHLARLDLREIEDLVDQLEQMAPRVADVADVLVLALVELAEHPVEQDVREADDRVQRRP